MVNTLLGTKKGMTSTYDARGRRVGATVVEILPNHVTQVKNAEGKGEGQKSDGYNAIQLGYGTKKSVKKPQIGHAKKAGIENPIRWFREIRIQGTVNSEQSENIKPGQEITLGQVFSIGDSVKVTGTSKGKGFQGGVRRHGFHGGPKTHGQSDRHRAPGSIGSGTTPGRVYKGKRMAGHMGVETVSTKNLEVVGLDKGDNLLIIKGAVPGPIGGLVRIEKLGRIKGYTPPPEEKEEEGEGGGESVKDEENIEAQASKQPAEQAVEEPVTEEAPVEAAAEEVAPAESSGEPKGGEENAG